MMTQLMGQDPALAALLAREERRQRETLEMIASESIQPAVALSLAGSAFNNKTAVGGPGNQRLMGSEVADALERLAAERACEVFLADHANLLPYSGSVANYCCYAACLNPGDRVLALDPAAGSHQTHGGNNNITAKQYDFRYFGLERESLLIDYGEAERMAREFCPKLMVVGSAAYSRLIDFERLARIAHENGALLMVDIAHFSGLIAAGVIPSPVPYADLVTASTTKTMCGPHSGFILCKRELGETVDRAVYPGTVASLHLQTMAAMTYSLGLSQTEEFRALMRRVVDNAKALCEALGGQGFGVVTGGTDCHMFVADLRPLGADAADFAEDLGRIGITVNTKGIPYDESGVCHGIRAGSTVLSQRGMGRAEMGEIAKIWRMVADAAGKKDMLLEAEKRVAALVEKFPIFS